ncbi:hypothetical protein KI688_004178 [Linnemannia hyalina]|uniref:RZ-type domain-containing protein n=1 Tax=Linnemannia hyalina TaxID=64524 RepID=A0A9P8BPV4_9FUNG|nr:hypothetical protein KI688_004178 [Linnemannia hyalina]
MMVQRGGRGQFNAGRGGDRTRGLGDRGRGRGRGQRYTTENISEITTRRTTSAQIGSEATDDLLIAPTLDSEQQHLAHWYLSKIGFDGFRTQKQVRDFVHSLLVNLSNHHSVDTSGLLTDMASSTGLARLREVLQRNMVINAGFEKDRTSFQYVVLPLIGVLTRENVCQSTLVQESGRIYAEVYGYRQQLLDQGVLPCMRELINRGSMDDISAIGKQLRADRSLLQVVTLQRAMLAVVRLVYQLVKRIQGAKKEMIDTISAVQDLAKDCIERSDDSQMSRFLNQNLERECQRLRYMVSAPVPPVVDPASEAGMPHPSSQAPNLVHLRLNFDPPGHLSAKGPRHDNDHAMIKDIQVVPTQDELTCTRPAFLPSNDVPGAPHHLLPGWPRLLDTHFRLNREDMIDQLRRGIMAFLDALRQTTPDRHGTLLNRRELRRILGQDASVYAYGSVEFLGANTTRQLQGSIKISFDQPPQIKSQSGRQREIFWQRSKRRLMQGSLVCFIHPVEGEDTDSQDPPNNQDVHIFLGVVSFRDVREMAKDSEKAVINVSLTNPTDYFRFVSATKSNAITPRDCFMVESMGGFFEAYHPILKTLQTCEPGDMPFGKYLAPAEEQEAGATVTNVDPPLYARAPDFEFDLTVLLAAPATCRLDVQDPLSHQQAVVALRDHSNLDDTQSQALVDSLCREVALVRGPPGTGKTKIGVDLMRVLVQNSERKNFGPILCICYTNHALDQFLEHLLDQGITRLIRIGSRSQSEKLRQYGLGELMKVHGKAFAVRAALAQAYAEWETVAQELEKIDKDLRRSKPLLADVLRHIMMDNDDQYFELECGDGRREPDKEPKSIEKNHQRWSTGADLAKMGRENRRIQKKWTKTRRQATKRREKILAALSKEDLDEWEVESALADIDGPSDHVALIAIPNTNRPLNTLRDASLWTMSMEERERLQKFWTAQAQEELQERYTKLQGKIQSLSKRVSEAHDEIRRGILRKAYVIGMTTNGAAKFNSMITALSPKIIICEEAGEVLESHILAALSGSTQHLILIGDHLQLRPQIATYVLSSDSRQGSQHNLDRSLFERLVATDKIPSSPLATQRRMRSEICNLVRPLYPYLVDGEQVLNYPDVSGMATNVFFMDHRHPEDSRDQYGIQSYANTFEAEMVKALVFHLIKNGYQQSSITVLTPYLGQLSRLRDTLGDIVRLAIDERDQEQLDALKDEMPTAHDPWKAATTNRTLTLRTIDNFQGEEADIIIISLVRSNTREDHHGSSATIGFLKSRNRTTVLLSRARHGMYLIGNASLMDQPQNGIWPDVMAELHENDRIGNGFLLRCRNHPETEFMISYPTDFKTYAPNGGCTRLCDQVLHALSHVLVCILNATMSVPRSVAKSVATVSSPSVHFLFRAVMFSPKPTASKDKTHRELDAKNESFESCHTASMNIPCIATRTPRPSSAIKSAISFSIAVTLVPSIALSVRLLRSVLMVCLMILRQVRLLIVPTTAAVFRSVANSCTVGIPVVPTVTSKTLSCGHQCPSVCGERCPPLKFCVECKSDPSVMEMIVDLIMQEPLSDVDVNEDPLLVLPCGHALVMSSLDGLMEMNAYYEEDINPLTGEVAFVMTKSLPNSEVPMIGCPSCRAPIASLVRYGRRIKYSQLVMRLKKFEMLQSAAVTEAEKRFTAAQDSVHKNLPAFLDKISKIKSPNVSRPPKKSKNVRRGLGQFEVDGASFPNTDVTTLFRSYDINPRQERAWKELIQPTLDALKTFDEIREQATVSPPRRLFEASVAHLYRFKSQVFYVDSAENGYQTFLWTPEESQRVTDECCCECGLSPDHQAGSSFVQAIQGRSNVLLLILHAALQALEKGGGIGSGWYWFVEGLLLCCAVHAGIQRDAAIKGHYPRIEMCAKMNLLDVLYKRLKWIGRRPFDKRSPEQQQLRQKAVDEVLEQFMNTLKEIEDSDQIGLRNMWLPKARELESSMVTAVKIALCQLDQPLTQAEKFEVFRAMQIELHGAGHFFRCPNGHSYVIGECGGAMQESICPECGAGVGGRSHQLAEGNQVDTEYESFYRSR